MNLVKRAVAIASGLVVFAIIIACSTVLLDRRANRGYCNSTGDFFESDNMLVLQEFSPLNAGWVRGKDGQRYYFKICPDSEVGWHVGDYIESAKYEFRNGCASFSSPLTSFRKRR